MGARQRAPSGVTIRYELGEAAAASRARATAIIDTFGVLAPLALVVALLYRLGYAGGVPLAVACGALAVLSVVRGGLAYQRLVRRLRRFRVVVGEAELSVETASHELTAPRAAIARVVELPGRFGGLRVELSGTVATSPSAGSAPERVDIPRGGERFGDVRAALEAWCGIARAPRRGRVVWIALGVLVVTGIFFLPFALEALGRSKPLAIALVVATWVGLRAIVRRR
jgi:hypothetical protein